MAQNRTSQQMQRRRRRKPHKGAAVVEFAIVAPVFFLLVFAAVEFGRLNIIRHTADNAAYEAARTGIVPGATRAEVEAKANELLDIISAKNPTIDVQPPVIDASIDEVTVSVSIPAADNGWVVSKFTNTIVLHSSATLRTERYRGIP